jgi:hypothetical protein
LADNSVTYNCAANRFYYALWLGILSHVYDKDADRLAIQGQTPEFWQHETFKNRNQQAMRLARLEVADCVKIKVAYAARRRADYTPDDVDPAQLR